MYPEASLDIQFRNCTTSAYSKQKFSETRNELKRRRHLLPLAAESALRFDTHMQKKKQSRSRRKQKDCSRSNVWLRRVRFRPLSHPSAASWHEKQFEGGGWDWMSIWVRSVYAIVSLYASAHLQKAGMSVRSNFSLTRSRFYPHVGLPPRCLLFQRHPPRVHKASPILCGTSPRANFGAPTGAHIWSSILRRGGLAILAL